MIYLRKVIKYIKNLFIKNKIEDIKETEEVKEIKLDVLLEKTQDVEDILIEEKQTEEESFVNLFDNIAPGDIIWAKRYSNEIEKGKIIEGHSEGPFLVIKKVRNSFLCSYGTSVEPCKEYSFYNFNLDNIKYNLKKTTYFQANKLRLIDENMFIEFLDRLSKKDNNLFFEKIKKITKNKYQKIYLNLPIKSSNIIYCDGEYFLVIDDTDDKKFVCIGLNKFSGTEIKDFSNLDYSNIKIINKSKKCIYVDALDNIVFNSILKKYKEYLKYSENQKVTQRGSIIFKDSEFYYIYGEESETWSVFKITKNEIKNGCKLSMKGTIYFSNFNDLNINKKSNFKTIGLCTDSEIQEIKEIRKKYKKEQKKNEEYNLTQNLRFDIGDIIKTKYYKDKRYIIVESSNSNYECLDIDMLRQGINETFVIRKQDTFLSDDKSIKGIKWLEQHPGFNLSKINRKDIISQILDTQINYLISQKNLLKSQRGCFIHHNNKYYYIYGEEGECWLVFELTKYKTDKSDEIKINDELFYTDYTDIKINKKCVCDILNVCDELKIEEIKSMRTAYKRECKKKLILQKNNSKYEGLNLKIGIGSIVKFDDSTEEEFTVKSILGNILVCVSNMDKQSSKRDYYLNKESVVLVKTKQKKK